MSFDKGSFQADWVDVPAGAPFGATGKTPLLSCDSTLAAPTINFDGLPFNAQIQLVRLTGATVSAPVPLNAVGAGITIESLSAPGTFVTTLSLGLPGEIAAWKFDASTSQWKLLFVANGPNAAALAFEDLFGRGTLGAVTINGGAPAFVGGDYTTFTLGPGGTLTATGDGSPIIIRCTQAAIINGTINADGGNADTAAGLQIGSSVPGLGAGGGGGGGGDGAATSGVAGKSHTAGITEAFVTGAAIGCGLPSYGLAGAGGGGGVPSSAGLPGGPGTAGTASALAVGFANRANIRAGIYNQMLDGGCPGAAGLSGGGGGQGAGITPGGNGGGGGQGGAGGGAVYIIAPSITIGGTAVITARGTNGLPGTVGGAGTNAVGTAGGGGGGGGGCGGQGGSGGLVIILGDSITGTVVPDVTPGTGAAGAAGGAGGAGSGGGLAGGAGGAGAAGADGAAGFAVIRLLGHNQGAAP